MHSFIIVIASIYAANAAAPEALPNKSEPVHPIKCTDEVWFKGPYVPNAKVAENIFKAINNVKPNNKTDAYQSRISVADKINYWEVEAHTLVRQRDGKYGELAGASYWMDIDKCKATILNAGSSR